MVALIAMPKRPAPGVPAKAEMPTKVPPLSWAIIPLVAVVSPETEVPPLPVRPVRSQMSIVFARTIVVLFSVIARVAFIVSAVPPVMGSSMVMFVSLVVGRFIGVPVTIMMGVSDVSAAVAIRKMITWATDAE